MIENFAQLGIPFPFFEGPSDQADEYCGLDTCSLCLNQNQHCFRLDIGCAVMVECTSCGMVNGLDASDRESCKCRQCNETVSFPDSGENGLQTCYSCLRSGKAAITKDTELGMISWEEAFEGITHGLPGLTNDDFEMIPRGNDWVGARLPQEMMFELLRTPNYLTIQGERWQFCCREAMVFVGQWRQEQFAQHAPDGNGQLFFEQIVQDRLPWLWTSGLHEGIGVYVFRCGRCGRMTAHWDID